MSLRTRTISTYLSGGWQAYKGPGTLLYATMDGTDLSSNVLTLYDSDRELTTDVTVATWTQDTDFGTTVPAAVYKDGSVAATLATVSANTKRGVPFFHGLFVNKTGDTTHNAALKLLIKPLIKKTVNLGHGATTDSVRAFDGPGILHAVRLQLDPAVVNLATLDLLFRDGVTGGTLRTLSTATDYATAGPSVWSPVTTTGIDDAGTAVTTAATGSYTNEGPAFYDGLTIAMAQGSAAVRNAQLDLLIEK